MRITLFHAVFATVVALCLAQVAWWTVFHGLEASRLEAAGEALARRDVESALKILGARAGHTLAEEARRRFVMFTSESVALSVALLAGVVTFFVMLRQRWRMVVMQERFLAGATHAWRTPLTSLRLGIESFLAGRVPDQKRTRYLTSMLGEVDRLDHDVGNLLAAAQLSRPGTSPLHELGDLRVDVEKAMQTLQVRAEAVGVSLVPDLTEATILREPAALGLVVQNLIDNAVKYSKTNGRVSVRLAQDGKMAQLTVSDQGVGMTAEDLEGAFARFSRGSAKEYAGGTGLGLWIAREIVRAHGGTISAASQGREKGSTFTVRLPLARSPA